MKRSLGLSGLKKDLSMAVTVAAVLTIATCLNPDSAQAKKCSLTDPCPKFSGSPNSDVFTLDFDIDFSNLYSSTGLFPDVIQNAKYTACTPPVLGLSRGCPTFSLFFNPSYLIASSLPNDDFRFPGGTVYETLVSDQTPNFLKFSIFLPSSAKHDPLHSLLDLQQSVDKEKMVQLSSSSLNNPSAPSSGGVQPIRLTDTTDSSTNVPENPLSILVGTGILGSILFLKRMKRSS
jgi:hypothetical protein